MKNAFERVLLIQPEGELAQYTMGLLDEIGFRHVVHAQDVAQAERLWRSAVEKHRPFQLVVCDDEVNEGGLAFHKAIPSVPLVVFSNVNNPRNLRLAAKVGIPGLVFRPYGRSQLERALQAVLKVN